MTTTIGELSTRCARRYPNKNATVFRGEAQTFAAFNGRVNQLVHYFNNTGLKKGDKVGVLSYNSPRVLEIIFATAKAGLVYVPVNFRLAPPEMKFIVEDAEISLLFVGKGFRETSGSLRSENFPSVISMEEEYEELLYSLSLDEPELLPAPGDLFAIFYTSGTTGGPKGVMLSHENFLSAVLNSVIAYRLGPYDVCYHAMPFYHTMEVSMAMCQFYVGGSNIITDVFDPCDFWEIVSREKVTFMTLVPTMLRAILDVFQEGGYHKGSFKKFGIGGQVVPRELVRRTLETLGDQTVFNVYGLTEASPLLTCLPLEEYVLGNEKEKRLNSVGIELFSCHVKVVDQEDREVAPGEQGEIIARGPNIMQGYWKRPQETKEALRGGWLRTGDIGTVDHDSYIYVVDRKKDLIISGGENISPYEVEEVLYCHPSLSECAVIGVPDEKWGEKIEAVVSLKNGKDISEMEIIEFCRNNLAAYKIPRSVRILESLPKDPVGKIQKKVLREGVAR